MEPVSILILLAAVFVGWSIGATSGSNAVGTLVGSRIIGFRTATLVVAVLMLAGALLQSGPVAETVGGGIVPREILAGCGLAVLSTLLASMFFLVFMTSKAIPVSVSHVVVGALVGSGISMGVSGEMDYFLVLKIFLSWFLTPVFSLILAFIFYEIVMVPASKKVSLVTFSEASRVLVVLGTCFVAYGLGANSVGSPAGLVIGSGVVGDTPVLLIVLGVAMGFGVVSFSRRVVYTIARNITVLDPMTAFAAQFSAGVVIYFFTLLGIPISTTQAIVGGLVGVGLTKGVGMVNNKLVKIIFLGWVITPFSAAILSMLIYTILKHLPGL
ncbi:MAG: inorganic phosphate transporter [Candidatus Altiarchaeota archaeon]|nr:inorganic phosphate transporter [Candidatus Altiarchaeota archaeon]